MEKVKHGNFVLLPPGARKNNRSWLARSREVEFVTGELDLARAKAVVDSFVAKTAQADEAAFGYYGRPRGDQPALWLRRLRAQAEDRARKGKLVFALSKSDMLTLAARAAGRCEVTGLPFSDAKPAGCARRPFGPSLDRIAPAEGYTLSNCRLVCFAVNVAMSDWGEATLRTIASAMLGSPTPRHLNTQLKQQAHVLGKDGVGCSIHLGGTITL